MATVTGSATVGGVAFPVAASLTLPGAVPPPPPPVTSQCYYGLWDDSFNNGTSISGAAAFSAAPVKSMTFYTGWLTPFPSQLNSLINAAGAVLYLNLEPWNTAGDGPVPSMADIGNGKYDSYLTQVGQAIAAGGHPVALTFAHEMNGNGWYPWQQSGGVTPATWVTTWKHVVTTVRASGGLSQWVWCPNNADVGPVTPYWPGAAYVDVAGFDGYLNQPSASQTYASFVKPTVEEIRTLTTTLPIWNAETGVSPGSNRAQRYAQFISDMHADGLIGFTQFNEGSYLLNSSETSALAAAVNAWNSGTA